MQGWSDGTSEWLVCPRYNLSSSLGLLWRIKMCPVCYLCFVCSISLIWQVLSFVIYTTPKRGGSRLDTIACMYECLECDCSWMSTVYILCQFSLIRSIHRVARYTRSLRRYSIFPSSRTASTPFSPRFVFAFYFILFSMRVKSHAKLTLAMCWI